MSKPSIDLLDPQRRKLWEKLKLLPRRGAFRDYADVYFILRDHLNIATIIREAEKRFGAAFSAKLFLQQLCYFGDINDYLIEYIDKKIPPNEIKNFLKKEVSRYAQKALA